MRFLARAIGRADSIASRTGSNVHPAVGTAQTWTHRAIATAYAEPKDDSNRYRFGIVRLADSGGKFDGGLREDGPAFDLVDISETQLDILCGLSENERLAVRRGIQQVLNSAMPHPGFRTPMAEVR